MIRSLISSINKQTQNGSITEALLRYGLVYEKNTKHTRSREFYTCFWCETPTGLVRI